VTSLEVETEKLKEAIAKFQGTSKRSLAVNLRQQGKLIAVDIAKRTPPGDFQASGWKRVAGENMVKADIAKIMRPSNNPKARTDPAQLHEQYKKKRGRVREDLRKVGTAKARDGTLINVGKGKKDGRYLVDAQTLKIYIERVRNRVGWMAAGWAKAASFLGASLPSWITRHSAPGTGTVVIRGDDIELELTNSAVYADSHGLVDRRAVAALKKRYWAMTKQADNYIKKAAEEAGFTASES
jgi:hypothetical protein